MQVTLNPGSAAEVRLIAAFMNDYADLVDIQNTSAPAVSNDNVAPGAEQFKPVEEKPAPKRTRKTSAATAETPAESGSSETASPAGEAGNENAPAVTESAESTEAQAGEKKTESATAPASDATEPDVTHDDLRKLFGELSQQGEDKRKAAIAVVTGAGFKMIKEITKDKLAEVFAGMKAL